MTADDSSTRLRGVQERIERACGRAGRDSESVRLVAVSKTFPAEQVRQLMTHGQFLFGENRVQEALAKIPEVGAGAVWHMIGPLQRNKARHAVGVFELIHAIDGARLAEELNRRTAATGRVQPILVQLNLAGEATKSGLSEEEFLPLAESILELKHLRLRGLMTIPPPAVRAEDNRGWFAALRTIRDRAESNLGLDLPELSMGMTDDFEVAVEEGATLVRVGRAIFGERN